MCSEPAKQKFIGLLENQPWDSVTSNYNLVSSFNTFFDTINKCFEESFPEKNSKGKQNAPWMTPGLENINQNCIARN